MAADDKKEMAANLPSINSGHRPPKRRTTEIRWHARGGQGAKTASIFLAESAIDTGYFAQGFPDYGPERMGAPMRAYNRISDKQIRVNAAVRVPDIVVILDDTLLDSVNVADGAHENTVFILNTTATDEDTLSELREKIGEDHRIVLVDANNIAMETIGRPIPNTPMVGAMLKATNLLPVENVVEGLSHKLGKKFPPKVVEGNVAALQRAYAEAREL